MFHNSIISDIWPLIAQNTSVNNINNVWILKKDMGFNKMRCGDPFLWGEQGNS